MKFLSDDITERRERSRLLVRQPATAVILVVALLGTLILSGCLLTPGAASNPTDTDQQVGDTAAADAGTPETGTPPTDTGLPPTDSGADDAGDTVSPDISPADTSTDIDQSDTHASDTHSKDTAPADTGPARCNFGGTGQGVCSQGRPAPDAGGCIPPDAYQSTESKCDQKDNDCNGKVDEGCPCAVAGVGQGVCSEGKLDGMGGCTPPNDYESGGETLCDGRDNDCDGTADEDCMCMTGDSEKCYSGAKGTEGVGPCIGGTRTCTSGTWGDCMGEVTPTTKDKCGDGVDNNCNGVKEEFCSCNYKSRARGICSSLIRDKNGTCPKPNGFETTETTCDGFDNDCDGEVDEGCDTDQDGYCEESRTVVGAPMICPQGGGDCDDTKKAIHPGATEVRGDEVDQNCDGAEVCFADADNDGHRSTMGTPTTSTNDLDCDDSGEAPRWAPDDDCDDTDPAIHGGHMEVCGDNKDNNCDGKVDEATRSGGAMCTKDCHCLSGTCSGGFCAHRVFLTSPVTVRRNGITGANGFCGIKAAFAKLRGNWKAILGTTKNGNSYDPSSKLTVRAPVHDMKGTVIATSETQFWNQRWSAAITLDPSGRPVSNPRVWTGLNSKAQPSSNDCNGWTSDSAQFQGNIGDPSDRSDDHWHDGDLVCNDLASFLCISVP